MYKIILSMLIVISSTFVGFYISSRLHSRKRILTSFVSELKSCATHIRYNSGSLAQIFSNNFMNYSFADDKPFFQQWSDMLSMYKNVLKKEDIGILSDFAKNLGTCDTAGELSNISLHIDMLNAQINNANSEIEAKSKLYKTLGASLGLAVAILLV